MNPRLAFGVWIALGVAAMGFELLIRVIWQGKALRDEIEHYGWVTYSAAMFAAVLLGPITAAGVVAMVVHRRELAREQEREELEVSGGPIEAMDPVELERELERSVERMAGCRHERTVKVDYGSGYFADVDKCVDCWAFRMPDGRWQANCSPPPRRG
jgi:hypothetical protein